MNILEWFISLSDKEKIIFENTIRDYGRARGLTLHRGVIGLFSKETALSLVQERISARQRLGLAKEPTHAPIVSLFKGLKSLEDV